MQARDAALAAKEVHENAVLSVGPALVAGNTLLAARPATVLATAPSVLSRVATVTATPALVSVTPAPAVLASAAPAVFASAAPAAAVVHASPAAVVASPAVAPAVVAPAAVAVPSSAVVVNPVVTTQYHAQDELGQYTFGYSGGPSAKHETKTLDGVTRGGNLAKLRNFVNFSLYLPLTGNEGALKNFNTNNQN